MSRCPSGLRRRLLHPVVDETNAGDCLAVESGTIPRRAARRPKIDPAPWYMAHVLHKETHNYRDPLTGHSP